MATVYSHFNARSVLLSKIYQLRRKNTLDFYKQLSEYNSVCCELYFLQSSEGFVLSLYIDCGHYVSAITESKALFFVYTSANTAPCPLLPEFTISSFF